MAKNYSEMSIEDLLGEKHKLEGNKLDNRFLVFFNIVHYSLGCGGIVGVFKNEKDYLKWIASEAIPYIEFCCNENKEKNEEKIIFSELKKLIKSFLKGETEKTEDDIFKSIEEELSSNKTLSWGYNVFCQGSAAEIFSYMIEENYI